MRRLFLIFIAVSLPCSAWSAPRTVETEARGGQFSVRPTGSPAVSLARGLVNPSVSNSPVITQSPTNLTASANSSATFSVMASGTAPLAYQWYKNKILISGASASTYVIPSLSALDNGASIFVVVTDGDCHFAVSASATLQVSIAPPIAQNQTQGVVYNGALSLNLVASDPNGFPLTYAIVQSPMHGTLMGSGAQRSYRPAAGYSGVDSFTFKANNGYFDSNVATIALTINVPGAPSASGNSLTTSVNTPIQISLVGLDPNSVPLTYIITQSPAHGMLSGAGAQWTYTPTTSYSGSDTFTFKVSNGTSESNVATVNISIVDSAPQPLPDPDLSGIDGKVFLLTDTISIPYGSRATSFNWQFQLIASAGASMTIKPQSSFYASATLNTPAPHFTLANAGFSPGAYDVSVQAVNGSQLSNWKTARVSVASVDSGSHIRVLPNPWKASVHTGQKIQITGLSNPSHVKILSVSGRLVKDLGSVTGNVFWDLSSDAGEGVASGIYFYLVTDSEDHKYRGKFAVIR